MVFGHGAGSINHEWSSEQSDDNAGGVYSSPNAVTLILSIVSVKDFKIDMQLERFSPVLSGHRQATRGGNHS